MLLFSDEVTTEAHSQYNETTDNVTLCSFLYFFSIDTTSLLSQVH